MASARWAILLTWGARHGRTTNVYNALKDGILLAMANALLLVIRVGHGIIMVSAKAATMDIN